LLASDLVELKLSSQAYAVSALAHLDFSKASESTAYNGACDWGFCVLSH